MSRPAGADAELTKRRLIDAATAEFSRCGVAATSMRAVARDAEVSLATIHYYFRTKSALHAACMDAVEGSLVAAFVPMEAILGGVSAALESTQASQQALAKATEKATRRAFRIARKHQRELKLVMRPWMESGELDPRWRENVLLPFLDTMSVALAARLGRPARQLRLDIQSLMILGTRFALTTSRELAEMAGTVAPGAPLRKTDETKIGRAHV